MEEFFISILGVSILFEEIILATSMRLMILMRYLFGGHPRSRALSNHGAVHDATAYVLF